MVSTLIGYKFYAGNLSKSLERIEATGSVKRDKQYYADNIGGVTSVDDLLNDYRLYSYAMKAYGLEDQIASKGLIRKVLESDLADTNSFANKLTDKKYRTFAAAFNFGALASTDTKLAQSTAQTESVVDAYSDRRVRQGVAAAAKTSSYSVRIGSVQSVDDILDDPTLYDVVLSSIGADETLVSKSFVRQALTGTLPNNVSVSNPGWLRLHEKFNFNADGSIRGGMAAQAPAAVGDMIYDYNAATGNNTNSYAAAFNTDYLSQTIGNGGVATVDDLVDDERLFNYITTAFGFDPSVEDPTYVGTILASDASDPSSPFGQMMANANTTQGRKDQFTKLRAVFNFDTDGTAAAGGVQTAAQQNNLTEAYFRNYQALATATDTSRTKTFKYLLSDINSVTDLLTKSETFGRDAINYVLDAFDIDPAATSLSQLRRVLTSDVSDPESYVNKLKDERFVKLAAAFNFDSSGKVTSQRLIQSIGAQTATGAKYTASFGEKPSAAKQEVIKTETKAYLEAIGSTSSLDDLLKESKTLDYALKAYGLDDDKLSIEDIRKILTSDLSDRKSFANSKDDGSYVEFAKAFNFTTNGTVTLDIDSVQSQSAKLTTENLFLLQTLEEKAGNENEGVRLALYFRRTAPLLTSTTAILADKAALEVVKTAFGLPDGFTQLDTAKQVEILDKKIKVADFKDPIKLDKFITRFSALYDVSNAQTSDTSPILQLFGATSSSSGILDFL